jgi:hypothetical protein
MMRRAPRNKQVPPIPPNPGWHRLLGRNRTGKIFPFRTSPELEDAISKAHLSLASILSCPHPPFWDYFEGWNESFEVKVQRLVHLRSVERLEACEHLEDLLVALQDRRAEVLRVTIYQILYELPPLRRRNRWGDLGLIDQDLLRNALSRVSPDRLRAALAEPGWPPLAKAWVMEALHLGLLEGERAVDRARGGIGIRGDALGPATLEVLQEIAQEVAAAPCLLPLPQSWLGCSCFDLRLEHLSNLAADHLAQWPVREDLFTALAGCSEENRLRILGRYAPDPGQPLADQFEPISSGTSWRLVVQAQRRLTWWLKAVDFQPRLLNLYDSLKNATASETEEIRLESRVSSHVLETITAMAKVYPAAGTGMPDERH